jgi:hypothetical protein
MMYPPFFAGAGRRITPSRVGSTCQRDKTNGAGIYAAVNNDRVRGLLSSLVYRNAGLVRATLFLLHGMQILAICKIYI